jgi:excisionase family DNA binding protein
MRKQAPHAHLSDLSAALPQLLTPDQVAHWLGTSRKAIYAKLERGQLARQAVVRIGRRLYFRGDALLLWLEQQGRVP